MDGHAQIAVCQCVGAFLEWLGEYAQRHCSDCLRKRHIVDCEEDNAIVQRELVNGETIFYVVKQYKENEDNHNHTPRIIKEQMNFTKYKNQVMNLEKNIIRSRKKETQIFGINFIKEWEEKQRELKNK